MLKPTQLSTAQSSIAVPSAPLCDMNAIFPACGFAFRKEAFRPIAGIMTPRQFGPIIRQIV